MPQKKPPTPAIGPLDAFVKRPEPPKRMGRPPKRKRGGGRPKKKMNDKENDTESDKTEDLNSSERLRRAVDEWRRCGKEPGMTRRKLARKYRVPTSTLCKYVLSGKNVPEQPRCGRKPRYLSHESREVMVETIIRYDRGDRGLNRQECSRIVQDLATEPVTRRQANDLVDYLRKLDRRSKTPRLTGMIRAQRTTYKRTAITIENQFRFQRLVEEVDTLHLEQNIDHNGVRFKDVADHFKVNLDEMSFAANDINNLVIGERGRKKHEKIVDDSRKTITVMRSGNAHGNQGPSALVLAGKKNPSFLSDGFIKRHGGPPGTCVVMTENAFMTDEAWLKAVPNIAEGVRICVDVY